MGSLELKLRPYRPLTSLADSGERLSITPPIVATLVVAAKSGLEAHTSLPNGAPDSRSSSPAAPANDPLPPKPSSLIQNRNDHNERIRYGSQPNHTLATSAALIQTSRLRNMYLVV